MFEERQKLNMRKSPTCFQVCYYLTIDDSGKFLVLEEIEGRQND